MKFTLSLAAAAAVFAIGASAHPPVGDGEELMRPQTGDDITARLGNITADVIVLRETFMAFISQQVNTTKQALKVSEELQDYLDETGKYFANGALFADTVALDDKQSLWVRQQYDLLYRNVSTVTKSLRKNIKVVDQTPNGVQIIGAVLPKLEGSFDVMYDGLVPYISSKYNDSIAAIHRKLDDELEKTLAAYKFNDISPDDNPIAGSNEFPADSQADPDIFMASPIPVQGDQDQTDKLVGGKDQTTELAGGQEKMVPTKKKNQAESGATADSMKGSDNGNSGSTQGSTGTQWMVGNDKKVAKPASDWINKNIVDKNMMKPKGPEDK